MNIELFMKILSALPKDASIESVVCRVGNKMLVLKEDGLDRIPEDTVYLHELPRAR